MAERLAQFTCAVKEHALVFELLPVGPQCTQDANQCDAGSALDVIVEAAGTGCIGLKHSEGVAVACGSVGFGSRNGRRMWGDSGITQAAQQHSIARARDAAPGPAPVLTIREL